MLDPSTWLFLPLIIAVVVAAVILRADSTGAILLLGAASLCCVVVALVASAAWSWLLRDGLGPDAVTSTGWKAWARFWQSFWPALVLTSLIGGAITVACWWRSKVVNSGALRAAAPDEA